MKRIVKNKKVEPEIETEIDTEGSYSVDGGALGLFTISRYSYVGIEVRRDLTDEVIGMPSISDEIVMMYSYMYVLLVYMCI